MTMHLTKKVDCVNAATPTLTTGDKDIGVEGFSSAVLFARIYNRNQGSVTVTVEHSPDGENWFPDADFPTMVLDDDPTEAFAPIETLGWHMRVVWTLSTGGSAYAGGLDIDVVLRNF
jgi:hypothetical protein